MIVPVSTNNIDWKAISEITSTVLLHDVTTGLTRDKINIKDFAALITIAPMDGEPGRVRDNLANETHLLKHQFVSFMLTCDRLTLKELQLYTSATISYNVAADDDTFLVLLTANVYDWVQSIRNLCTLHRSRATRSIGNELYGIFTTSAVLKNLFKDWHIITQTDKTFIVR